MGEKMRRSLSDFISIKETKFSVLILLLIVSCTVGMYMVITVGDIPVGLLQWLASLVLAITGINVTDSVVNKHNSLNNYNHYNEEEFKDK